MLKIPVQSRLIARVEYDPDLKDFNIYFRNGEVRAFEGVPTAVVTGLLSAQSPGNFYFEAIRGKFPRRTEIQSTTQRVAAA